MKLVEVNNKKLAKEFLDFPRELYADNTNWVCPLDSMIDAVKEFNGEK